MNRPAPPAAVRWIVRTLEGAGFETWAVGGAVRDALRGQPSADWDLATRAHPRQMQRIFRRTVPIGVDHGTVGILDRGGTLYEVTTFRRDVETTGRHAVVSFAETLREDLARRDFTINAVAWHPLREEFFDPFDGIGDLERGVLRTVGRAADRFAEDYLRVLRALRFAGRFRLRIAGESWQSLVEAVPGMEQLSPERVREELEKVLGSDEPPSAALSLYAASGALEFLYPELAALIDHSESASFRAPKPEKDSGETSDDDLWSVSLRAVDLIPAARMELRMAALLHAIGAGAPGVRGGQGRAPGDRADRAALRSAALLTRLRSSRARIRRVGGWVSGAADPPGFDAEAAELRRWLARVGREAAPGALRLIGVLARARRGSSPEKIARLIRRLRVELRSGAPLAEKELALDGRDLIRMGYRPGPEFGVVFAELLEWVLEKPARNEKDELAEHAVRRLEELEDVNG